MITVTLYPDAAPLPEDGTLLYEAEWNEGASQREHADAIVHFAEQYGPEAVEAAEKALTEGDPATGFAWLREYDDAEERAYARAEASEEWQARGGGGL